MPPEPTVARSRMVTSVMPRWVSDQAAKQPSRPPPTMTTSAVEAVSDMVMTFWFRHDDGYLAVVREWRRSRSCGLDHRRGDPDVAAIHVARTF